MTGASPILLVLLGASLAFLTSASVSLLTDRRKTLLFGIGVASAIEFQIGSLHLASALCAILFACAPPTGKPRPSLTIPVGLIASAALLASSVIFGSLVNSPSLAAQLLVLAGTAVVLLRRCSPDDIPNILRGVLAGSSFGSAGAVLQNIGIIPATLFVDSEGFGRVHSIYREPDFLAVFAAIGVILAFRLVRRGPSRLILLAVNGFALMYTFARAAALALVVSAIVTVIADRLAKKRLQRATSKRLLVAIAASAIAILAVNGDIRATVEDRFRGAVDSSSDISVQARERQFAGLIRLSEEAPWHGFGLSAAGRVQGFGAFEGGVSENNVATNWLLGWWVDGKLLALPLISIFMALALVAARGPAGQILIFTLVNSLFSNLMFFPITWVALALAALSIVRAKKPMTLSTPLADPMHSGPSLQAQ